MACSWGSDAGHSLALANAAAHVQHRVPIASCRELHATDHVLERATRADRVPGAGNTPKFLDGDYFQGDKPPAFRQPNVKG